MSEDAITIFYSYSRKDLGLRNTLEAHLSPLKKAKRIKTWHDLELEAGTEWERDIQEQLNTADIILLLVSSDFMASDYCYSKELERAIARHDAGEARVIPVILRPCDWNHSYVPFSKLNVLPTHAKAVTSWTDRDEAFAIVAQRIRETVDQITAKRIEKRQAEEKTRQQQIDQKEAEQQAERERLQREQQRLADERRRRHQVELSKQQEAEAAEKQRQQELERQQVLEQQKRENAQRRQASQTANTNELASEKCIDYTRLQDLLKAGRWEEADQETADRISEVMSPKQEGWFWIKEIQVFPCIDLRTIDRLWVKHSKGKFGFSVQAKVWQDCGSPVYYNKQGSNKYREQWEKFGEEVGWKNKGFLGINNDWKRYSEITFDMSIPTGHLPLSLYLLEYMVPPKSESEKVEEEKNKKLMEELRIKIRTIDGILLYEKSIDLFNRLNACRL